MLQMLKRILGSGTDIQALLAEGATVLDVRSVGEYKQGHGKGTKNIPLDKINSQLKAIEKLPQPIITCCASGMRSGSAASILKSRGIKAYNGGSWQKVERLRQ